MIKLRMWKAQLDLENVPGLADVCEGLPEVRPMLSETAKLYADLLGADRVQRRSGRSVSEEDVYFARRPGPNVVEAEVLTDGQSLIVVSLERVGRGMRFRQLPGGGMERVPGEREETLNVSYIGTDSEARPGFAIVRALETAFEVVFEDYRYTSGRFEELKREGEVGSPERPSADELKAAQVLANPVVRKLAIAIKSSGGLLLPDLEKQLEEPERSNAEQWRTQLEERGLIDAELVIICRRTQSQVNRVTSREVLQTLSQEGLRCACGRNIGDERTEEAIAITEFGQELLNGSRWMVVLLIEELIRVGVPLEGILVEQQIGGEEMDCFADVSGELAFFELKDKTFSLGNAYSFGAKLGIVQPEHPVIVTTEHVGNDAKEHFERAAAAGQGRGPGPPGEGSIAERNIYVEGLEHLRSTLERLAQGVFIADAERIVTRAFSASTVGGSEVFHTLLNRVGSPEADSESDLEHGTEWGTAEAAAPEAGGDSA